MTREDILNLPIKNTSLTVRTKNCLLAAKFVTFKDLLGNSYHHFLRIDGIGAKSVAEIIELVNSHGYKLTHQEFFYKKKAALPWVQKLIEAAVAAEREACAMVCEELETCSDAEFYGDEFANAIRARGTNGQGL